MELFPAVLIGGPPHSGKSVLSYNLSRALRQAKVPHYLLRAAPDGEGDWSAEARHAAVQHIRVKQDWSDDWVTQIICDIDRRLVPLLVDVGGKPTPDQEILFSHCTHAILLVPDEAALAEWRTYAERQGVRVIAELQSSLTYPDQIETTAPILQGILHGLQRGCTVQGQMFETLLQKLKGYFNYSYNEVRQIHADLALENPFVDLAVLRETWELGPDWHPHHLRRLLDYLPAETPFSLYERGPNWLYASVACHTEPATLYQFDVRLGWISSPKLKHGPIPANAPLQAVRHPYQTYDRLFFCLSEPYLDFDILSTLSIPPADSDKGLVLDGKLPMWLWTALARSYRNIPWLAVYQPQLETKDHTQRAVIVHSRVPDKPLGEYVLLDSPAPPTESALAMFDTPDNLAAWLKQQGIDPKTWGKGGAKTLDALYLELKSGEAQLQAAPPLRSISIVQIIIRQGDHILLEHAQEFLGMLKRERNQPLGEKIKPGETVSAAASRCLQEELAVPSEQIRILCQTHTPRVKQTDSPSYPGLQTVYYIYRVEAAVDNLPEADFWTEEKVAGSEHGTIRHHWIWVDAATWDERSAEI